MAVISENSVFTAEINRILTTDPVLGGNESTPANAAAKGLADRTRYLKDRMDDAGLTTSAVYASDLDSLLQSGFYFANSSSTNKPGSTTQGSVLVINNGGTDWVQIFADLDSDKIYYRRKASGTIQSWVLIKNDEGLAGSISFIQARLIDTITLGESVAIVSGMVPFNVNTGATTMEISAGFAIIDDTFLTVSAYSGNYPVYLIDDGNYTTVQPGSGNYITFDPYTGARQEDIKKRQMYSAGDIIYNATPGVLDNFDGTGLGKWKYEGWALCNGSNGTVDLGGQFPAVYDSGDTDYDTPGETGGAKEVTLTEANLPSPSPDPFVNGNEYGLIRFSQAGENVTIATTDNQNAGVEPDIITEPMEFPYNGQDTPVENRPPYKVVVAIQRV